MFAWCPLIGPRLAGIEVERTVALVLLLFACFRCRYAQGSRRNGQPNTPKQNLLACLAGWYFSRSSLDLCLLFLVVHYCKRFLCSVTLSRYRVSVTARPVEWWMW